MSSKRTCHALFLFQGMFTFLVIRIKEIQKKYRDSEKKNENGILKKCATVPSCSHAEANTYVGCACMCKTVFAPLM